MQHLHTAKQYRATAAMVDRARVKGAPTYLRTVSCTATPSSQRLQPTGAGIEERSDWQVYLDETDVQAEDLLEFQSGPAPLPPRLELEAPMAWGEGWGIVARAKKTDRSLS